MTPPDKPRQLAALFRPFEPSPEAPRPRPSPIIIPHRYPASTPLIIDAFNTVFDRVYLQLVDLGTLEGGPRLSNQSTWPIKLHWPIPATRDGREAARQFISDIEQLAPAVVSADTEPGEVTLTFKQPGDALTTLRALVERYPDTIFNTDMLSIKRFEDEADDALTDEIIAEGEVRYGQAVDKGMEFFKEGGVLGLLETMPPRACTGVWDALAVAYFNAVHALKPGCALINFKKLENAIAADTHRPTPHPLAALH